MDPDHQRLRALGYLLDEENRWIHPWLGAWLPAPEKLLALPQEQLETFHSDTHWLNRQEPPRPALEPDLLALVGTRKLHWYGWLEVWYLPSGAGVRHEDLKSLGADRMRSLLDGLDEWQERNQLRKSCGCLGMALMVIWLFTGWQWGSVTWLLGMALIAVGTWLGRPLPFPEGLWEGIEEFDIQQALLPAREALGPAWEEVAELTGALLLEEEELYLMNLDRSVRVDSLMEHFEPDNFLHLLHLLIPLENSHE